MLIFQSLGVLNQSEIGHGRADMVRACLLDSLSPACCPCSAKTKKLAAE